MLRPKFTEPIEGSERNTQPTCLIPSSPLPSIALRYTLRNPPAPWHLVPPGSSCVSDSGLRRSTLLVPAPALDSHLMSPADFLRRAPAPIPPLRREYHSAESWRGAVGDDGCSGNGDRARRAARRSAYSTQGVNRCGAQVGVGVPCFEPPAFMHDDFCGQKDGAEDNLHHSVDEAHFPTRRAHHCAYETQAPSSGMSLPFRPSHHAAHPYPSLLRGLQGRGTWTQPYR